MVKVMMSSADRIDDFTELAYRELLVLAKQKYRFSRYGESVQQAHLLWRHDIDVCLASSVRLARIEASENVRSTYFLFPRCEFYNLFNKPSHDRVREIIDLGHDIGLHFDPFFYSVDAANADIEKSIERELSWIADDFSVSPTAVSFHNYGTAIEQMPSGDIVCGVANAYGKTIMNEYGYVSDSNGVWRFDRLRDVLLKAEKDRLQVLTHPVWWAKELLPPRQRLQNSIDNAARELGERYDASLAEAGRPNVR
jgi:hypothetical protein